MKRFLCALAILAAFVIVLAMNVFFWDAIIDEAADRAYQKLADGK